MINYEAPAKVNLALHVRPPRPDGYHPLESLVQTIGWADELSFRDGEVADSLEVRGIEVPTDDNLILKALAAIRAHSRLSPQAVELVKVIPLGSGLGGGSSDAAAALAAGSQIAGLRSMPEGLAAQVGADVPLFLTGGTLMMSGIGDVIEPRRPLGGFSLAVVVPDFGLSTADVYRRWDEMEGPLGEELEPSGLPPHLREGIPLRNDLLPAALDLEPRLGDLMADLRSLWDGPVGMTGSGSACFGFFGSLDEAEDASKSVWWPVAEARGVALRDRGVARVGTPAGE